MPEDTALTATKTIEPRADFERAAENVASNDKIAQPDDRSVSATAGAEIEIAREKEAALDRHDQEWIRERERLADKALPAPTFDLGAQERRSVLSEYEERRTAWTRHQDQIVEHHEERRHEVRVNGRTVTDEFTASVEPTEAENDFTNTLENRMNDPAQGHTASKANQGQSLSNSFQANTVNSSRGHSR